MRHLTEKDIDTAWEAVKGAADPRIHVGDEAIAVCNGKVRAVGVAEMCGREMTDMKRGIAVRVRHKLK